MPEDEHAQITVTIYVDGQKVDESSGVPYNGFTKIIELDPKGAVNNQKIVTVMIDGIKYETFVFDFKNQTVSRTFIDTGYELKQGEESSEEPVDESSDETSDEESGEEPSEESYDESTDEESYEEPSDDSYEEGTEGGDETTYDEPDTEPMSMLPRNDGSFRPEGIIWM